MHSRNHAPLRRKIRHRRLGAAAMLLLVGATFLVIVFSNDADDPDGLMRMAWLIGGLMLFGTLGFGLSLLVLTCPSCGHRFGTHVAGGFELDGKSFVEALVKLIVPFRCPSCGFTERGD